MLPLDVDTVDRFREHRARQTFEEEQRVGGSRPGSSSPATIGSGLRPEYATRPFQRLAADAGVPVIRLHDVRHTNASLALVGGVALKVVSERLGHAQLAITADLYTHVGHDLARAAAGQIASALDGASVAFSAPVLPPTAVRGAGEP